MAKKTYDILRGFVGADVARLQKTLNTVLGAGLVVDGVYGGRTFDAIKKLEQDNGLAATGQCAGTTLAKARDLGFEAVEFDVTAANAGLDFPKKPAPAVLPQPTAAITASLFGTFRFQHTPVPTNPEKIKILGSWVADNIVSITVPQLVGVPIPTDDGQAQLSTGRVSCNKLAKDKILGLFQAWEDAGFVDRILTFDGSFNPRLKRGARTATQANLSNHSFGATFDINAELNPQGHVPRLMGARGCLRELVDIANQMDLYWGGHFGTRPDGMHFEVARL